MDIEAVVNRCGQSIVGDLENFWQAAGENVEKLFKVS